MELLQKIRAKKATLSVIGLGYVGLPLAVEFTRAGFNVVGIDIDDNKVKSIQKGKSYIGDVSTDDLTYVVKKGLLKATTDFSILRKVDTINICVPTPMRKTREPDVSYILSAVDNISRYLHKGQLVILESTTYPGTTSEVILPVLSSKGLKVGRDFYLAFSPERVDPGNPRYTTQNIPKVVGGITKACSKHAVALYKSSINEVISVSSSQVAEMVKLLENTYRSVNIGLVNEMAIMCDTMGIDVWEVIDAAASKPFGFMAFYPGPGVGGHCIGIDPHYLSWKARSVNFEARFIELAGEINRYMPEYVVRKITDALNDRGKSVKSSNILIMGIAYKKDVSDWRESPSIEIFKMLKKRGARITCNDPFVDVVKTDDINIKSVKLTANLLKRADCVVIATKHSIYDYPWIVKNSKMIVDTHNATKNIRTARHKIIKI